MAQVSKNQGIVMYGGNINARNIAAGTGATIIDSSSVASELKRMRSDIDALPDSVAPERGQLEKYRLALEAEASKERPKKSFLEENAQGLLDTAKIVAQMAPGILAGAEHVASWVATLI